VHSARQFLQNMPSDHVMVKLDFSNSFIAFIDGTCCKLSVTVFLNCSMFAIRPILSHPCCLRSPSHEQDSRKRNAPLSRVLRAAPLMLNEQSKILTSTEKSTTSKGDPPDRSPHRNQARRPRVPCCISPHYGIISTLKIPAVSSGATWTLQLRNSPRTCITQGPEYFRHPIVTLVIRKILKFWY